MDEDQIHLQVKKCKQLKFKFRGVYAADNYPLNLQTNTLLLLTHHYPSLLEPTE